MEVLEKWEEKEKGKGVEEEPQHNPNLRPLHCKTKLQVKEVVNTLLKDKNRMQVRDEAKTRVQEADKILVKLKHRIQVRDQVNIQVQEVDKILVKLKHRIQVRDQVNIQVQEADITQVRDQAKTLVKHLGTTQGRGQNPSQVVQGGRGRGRGRGGGAGGFNAPGQQGPPGFVQGPRPASSPVWGPQSNASPSPASMPPPVAQAPIQAPPPSWGQPTPQQSQAPRQPSSAPGGQSTPHQGQQPRQMAPAKAAGDAQSTPRSVQPRGAQAGKSSQAVVLPRRVDCPNEPKSGRQIVLEVNHLLLKIADPGVKIYHYDVSIDPDKPKRFLRLVMDEMQRKCYPQNFPGFDGSKNLYSKGPLPFKDEITEEVNVPDSERQDKKLKTFKVTIKLARNNISLQELFAYQQKGKSTSIPQDVVQAVDVILRSASAQKFVQVGRSFFCPPMTPRDLGNGMELWYGFFQSFVMGSKPYLNIDVAHKGFPKSQPLLSLLKAMDPRAEKPSDALRYKRNEFERFIKGLKVEYQLPNVETSKRTYRVNGLVRNAFDERFQLDDSGRTMSIGEYFEKEKKYTLRYPDLPCVHVGHRDKTIYVPMELCVLSPGQATMKKLDETQTAAMVRIAATNVQDRKNKIKEAMQRANLNSSPHVKELGLSVATEFAKINGRILPAPKLAYYQDRTVQPARGVWRMDGMQFRETRELDKWICLVINSRVRPDDIRSFTENLRSEAKRVNMVMAAPAPPVIMDVRDQRKIMGELSNRLGKFRQEGHKLVLVVISGYNKQIYGQVKQVAELQVGVLTQCVKDETVTRRNNQATVHNIMLKINAKFNGVNQVIADQSKVKCFNSKVLVFGADVTHPSPDSKDIPSVAAVTASHDIKGFKYNMRVRLQAPRQEMIEDLAAIVYEQLAIYKKETGFLPEHIVFYRDGVSEGQFHEVISKEVTAIFRACEQLRTKPKLTFLVVQKRHHTRFFPTDNRDSQDKNGNVPAGTIVDTEITHASEIDFYLVSHASIQGVARPTKYHVLWDDAHMSENDIQLMTYNLCHLFTRCDRAVSYPAPTYYAHLAASRGREKCED
ncbi:LOW QUALITY PROTEIN: Protein argonaute-2 [Frankliniella fusca]|uniref:Protein argonaute-2 n=1 Tax=Frankliniella fusca TaxID=407009 RepID=A0AAE1GVK7_9NEOP|nr:LOW QUALITY PROTEIN: Protein argonaute-2 [Frankliniella fusca]